MPKSTSLLVHSGEKGAVAALEVSNHEVDDPEVGQVSDLGINLNISHQLMRRYLETQEAETQRLVLSQLPILGVDKDHDGDVDMQDVIASVRESEYYRRLVATGVSADAAFLGTLKKHQDVTGYQNPLVAFLEQDNHIDGGTHKRVESRPQSRLDIRSWPKRIIKHIISP